MNIKETKQSIRVLFVPDQITGESSGARSARTTLRTLLDVGCKVAVYRRADESGPLEPWTTQVTYYSSRSAWRFNTHFFSLVFWRESSAILDEFRPDYIFFAGGIQKPSILARAARKRAIKTVYLFYITDYYCAKVYAGLEDGPCFKCLEENSFQALTNNCIKQTPKLLHFTKNWLVRQQVKKEVTNSYRVLGYSKNQLSIYNKYGVDKNKCVKIPFQFDPIETVDWITNDRGYFLLAGQPSIEKGWHTLSEVFGACRSDIRIKIVFKNFSQAMEMLKQYALTRFYDMGMIEIEHSVDERSEILSLISHARAAIVPSYYPTTGEFALLEPLLLGKPVAVYNVGAHKDLIIHRENGMVANVDELELFAENIDELNTDSSLRHSLSIGARELGKRIMRDSEKQKIFGEIFC